MRPALPASAGPSGLSLPPLRGVSYSTTNPPPQLGERWLTLSQSWLEGNLEQVPHPREAEWVPGPLGSPEEGAVHLGKGD